MRGLVVAFFVFLGGFAHAQTPPSPNEIANYSGLFLAVHKDDVPAIKRLLQTGADLTVRDGRGRTAIHIAAYASSDAALLLLAEAGADMNALDGQAYDVVTIAAVANEPDLMSLAIKLGNSPGLTTSPYEGTALIAAAHLGHVEIVKRLIAAGAPLDHINNLNWTAVMEAVVLGDGRPDHLAIVDALLTAGADRMIADRDGVTPLEHAILRGYSKMVERLQRRE